MRKDSIGRETMMSEDGIRGLCVIGKYKLIHQLLSSQIEHNQQLKRCPWEMASRNFLKSNLPKSECRQTANKERLSRKSLSPEGAAVKEKEQSVKILKKIQSKPKFDVVAKPALK